MHGDKHHPIPLQLCREYEYLMPVTDYSCQTTNQERCFDVILRLPYLNTQSPETTTTSERQTNQPIILDNQYSGTPLNM